MGPHIGLDSSKLFSWKSFVLNCMASVTEKIPSDEETTGYYIIVYIYIIHNYMYIIFESSTQDEYGRDAKSKIYAGYVCVSLCLCVGVSGSGSGCVWLWVCLCLCVSVCGVACVILVSLEIFEYIQLMCVVFHL